MTFGGANVEQEGFVVGGRSVGRRGAKRTHSRAEMGHAGQYLRAGQERNGVGQIGLHKGHIVALQQSVVQRSAQHGTQASPLYSLEDNFALVAAPHTAWAADEARKVLIQKIAENISEYLEKSE